MHCPECGTALPELALFCPKCGARTPDRAEPRAAAPAGPPASEPDAGADAGDDLHSRRRRVLGYAFVFVVLALAVGRCSWFDFDFDDQSGRARPPAAVEATALYDAYARDRDEAQEEYGDRGLVVRGEVVRVEQDVLDNPDLMLRTGRPDKVLRVDLLEEWHGASAMLKPGQTVTVNCQKMEVRFGGPDPWLRNCQIDPASAGTARATAGPIPTDQK